MTTDILDFLMSIENNIDNLFNTFQRFKTMIPKTKIFYAFLVRISGTDFNCLS